MSKSNDVARAHESSDEQSGGPLQFERVVENKLRAQEAEEEGSHTEYDPSVFHPSSVGYEPWNVVVKKLGIETHDTELLGIFEMGNLVHEFVQDAVTEQSGNDVDIGIEVPVEHEEDGLRFEGHADIYDPASDTVYDIKSRGGWYHFDPPNDRHLDQLHCYMRALDASRGQVVYVNKKNLEVRTYPEDGGTFEFDEARWADIVSRCHRVRTALKYEGIPTTEDEIPFDRPDNFYANNTDLCFDTVTDADGNLRSELENPARGGGE